MTILILGGYGNIGSTIATTLIESSDAHIIIAGHRYEPAERLAKQLGARASARKIDAQNPADYEAALQGVDLVVVCFDLWDERFPRACLGRGINYIDISAEREVLTRIVQLDSLAKQHNSTVLISAGLAPGISNLMAKEAIRHVNAAYRVDTVGLLGLGEIFGSASANWTLSHIGDRFDKNTIRMDLGEEFGTRTAYRYAFADQYFLPETLGLSEAASWVCFDRRLSTHIIGLVRTLRLGWMFRNPTIRRWIVKMSTSRSVGSDRFIIKSRVSGRDGNQTYSTSISGAGEAQVTAHVAAEVARKLSSEKLASGVHHIEQVFDLKDFLPLLSALNVTYHEMQ